MQINIIIQFRIKNIISDKKLIISKVTETQLLKKELEEDNKV